MDGEEEKNPEEQPGEQSTEQLIQAIVELKKSTVSKEDHEKLKAENAQLLKVLVEGGQITPPAEEKDDIDGLRKELYSEGSDLSNLEYCKKTLALRKAIMKRDGVDPFLPPSSKVTWDEADKAAANRVANVLEECIAYADGDSQIFTNELQRRMVDAVPQRRARK